MSGEAIKHLVQVLNASGASWFDPEHYEPAATGEYGTGYQPETFAAQEFVREAGGGWADGAGWQTPEEYRKLPVCERCGERFKGSAGPCIDGDEERVDEHKAADREPLSLKHLQEAVALALIMVDEHYPIGDEYADDYAPPEAVFRSLEARGLVTIGHHVDGGDATLEAFYTSEGSEYLAKLVRGEL